MLAQVFLALVKFLPIYINYNKLNQTELGPRCWYALKGSLPYGLEDLHLASKYLKSAFLISTLVFPLVGLMKYRLMVYVTANPMAGTRDGDIDESLVQEPSQINSLLHNASPVTLA